LVPVPDVKFCGLTRATDVAQAARLGAAFAGFVLTESARRVTPGNVFSLGSELAGTSVQTVGVFGNESEDDILSAAGDAGVAIVQLHGGANSSGFPARLRDELGVRVWHVVRVGENGWSGEAAAGAADADAVLLDTMSRRHLGGSGQTFDWSAVSPVLSRLRRGRLLGVAGGLRPENVRDAIEHLSPDFVDVSSGVESAPGVKDHARMASFMAAVRAPAPSAHK
jgi:phosphoribosylanthranilate isomerase